MFKVQLVRSLLEERLTAVGAEILRLFQRTIAEYEEEIYRLKEEKEHVKLLDAVLEPRVRLHISDEQQLLMCKDDTVPEQQECNQSSDQEDSGPSHIKEEDQEDCGGPEPAGNSGACGLLQSDGQQLLMCKEDLVPEQQECNQSVDQEDHEPPTIKEEDQELWIAQEVQRLSRPDEADVAKLPFAVPVKSDDEENPQSSPLPQIQTSENTKAEPVASSLPGHRILKTEADGGSEPACNSGTYSLLQSDTDDRSSECFETDGSYELDQTGETDSGLNYLKSSNTATSDCDIAKKQFNCSECGKRFCNTNSLRQHNRIQISEKPFSCPECSTKSQQKKNTSPTGLEPFRCSDCGKTFRHKSSLVKHMVIHKGEKLFHCLQCCKTFWENGKLKRHMRVHSGDKPFGCCQCGKRFGQRGSLKIHMRIHTGEKPFSCSDCGSAFRQKGTLERHKRIHTGEKPFVCSECNRSFGEKSTLESHRRIHTGEKPFVCSECDQRFVGKATLEIHRRIHTGEKPFACTVCVKRFRRKASLNLHLRMHTGDKPFGCPECSKTFPQESILKKHMITHTRKKRVH